MAQHVFYCNNPADDPLYRWQFTRTAVILSQQRLQLSLPPIVCLLLPPQHVLLILRHYTDYGVYIVGRRAFPVAGIWNDLPSDITYSSSLLSFLSND